MGQAPALGVWPRQALAESTAVPGVGAGGQHLPSLPAASPGGTRSGSGRLRHPAAMPDPAEQAPKPVIRGRASLCLSRWCGRELLTHGFNEQGAGVRSCCACCTRLPAPRWRASRSPSPLRRARRLAAALQTSGRFWMGGLQRFGLPCLVLASKLNASAAAGCLACDEACGVRQRCNNDARRLRAEAVRGGDFGRQKASGGGCWQEQGDASLLLLGEDAQMHRRSWSTCASHPAAISPVSHHTELSRHRALTHRHPQPCVFIKMANTESKRDTNGWC